VCCMQVSGTKAAATVASYCTPPAEFAKYPVNTRPDFGAGTLSNDFGSLWLCSPFAIRVLALLFVSQLVQKRRPEFGAGTWLASCLCFAHRGCLPP
jgi:hypothetical protein